MPIEYARDDAMTQAVGDLVQDESYSEFDELRAQDILFQVAAMTKTNKDGEIEKTSGDPVIVRKISPADAVFMEGHFKVFIDRCRWDAANELQQKAMLHRAVMRVEIVNEESGIKIKTRKPDVVTFQATIVRFGAWEEELIQLRNNLQAAQAKAKQTARASDNAKPAESAAKR